MFALFLNRLFLCFALSLWPAAKGVEKPAELKKSKLEIPVDLQASPRVRVALARGANEVRIASDFPFHVFDGEGRALFQGAQMKDTPVRSVGGNILLGTQSFSKTPIILDAGEAVLRVGKRTYRNSLEFLKSGSGRITVVNELGLEDYLKGVLPLEANPGWTVEALKAQAVVSRTYALFKVIENREEAYSVSDDVISQVYGGVTLEKPSTSRAVELTAGEILMDAGKIFPAYFHSTCGGATTRADYVWPIESHPALQGGSCEFCRESPHYRWKNAFDVSHIRKALARGGYTVPDIRNIKVGETDAAGRARFIVIEYSPGKLRVPASDFRLWMDPMKFKSVLIQNIRREGNKFIFQGRGWGHGAGMCQYGAKKMGELGYTYRQILDFYFPGASLKKLSPQTE